MAKKNNPETIDKERQVLELRRSGSTFDSIARTLGYAGPQGAHEAFKRALRRTLQQPADEIRQMEIDRLDRLQRATWQTALTGNPKAILVILKIMDRRAKLLGLDAPQRLQQEVTVYEGGTDIDREVQRLAELLATSGGITIDMGKSISEA